MPKAIELVGKMLGAYPNARDGIRNSYIGTMAALLCEYPRSVAIRCADPVHGVCRTTKFLPTVAELVAWCEPHVANMTRIVDFERRSREQLADRARREAEEKAEPLEHRIAVAERIRAELRAAGMRFHGDHQYHGETPETVKAKLGLTDEQWAGIPDAPPQGHWEHLAAQHRCGKP